MPPRAGIEGIAGISAASATAATAALDGGEVAVRPAAGPERREVPSGSVIVRRRTVAANGVAAVTEALGPRTTLAAALSRIRSERIIFLSPVRRDWVVERGAIGFAQATWRAERCSD